MRPEIQSQLKATREQLTVVGPIVELLVDKGWSLDQIIFGRREWLVPKTPSEATKREKGQGFTGFPVDIAVFESPETVRDPRHLLFIIECKQETEAHGVSQLEAYFVGEPHARLGGWANSPDPGAPAIFLYRAPDGRMLPKKQLVNDLPSPGEPIKPEVQRFTYRDLVTPNASMLRRIVEDVLDKTVSGDAAVTRREEQLDQLCNLLLLKLESDRQASSNEDLPVFFRPLETESRTATAIRERYTQFVALYPGVFTQDQDKRLRLTDHTIADVVDALSGLKLIELGVSTVSLAFQILRSEALKQNEGQYFTPQAVIEAGIRLVKLEWPDIVLDPACGTGGFLVEALLEMRRKNPQISESVLSRWAQTHIYGIDKDAIGTKLTKAVMQIAGDGSAHCVRGDSVRTHQWPQNFPHLNDGSFTPGRFSAIITNPPFGQNLKVSAKDARLSGLSIATAAGGDFKDTEIGIVYLQRCYDLLREGGRLGIILPETYFFSPNYQYLFDWIRPRFRPIVVANVPMEAFQGFCRAKTNFYVFEKIAGPVDENAHSVVFLNPLTCGIYKDGGPRFKLDPETGRRTAEVDNQLIDHVERYLQGELPSGASTMTLAEVYAKGVLVPTYYDTRFDEAVEQVAIEHGVSLISIGELLDQGLLRMRRGHGSPGNDQRSGTIPYVKVSDLRALRININPTNLVPVQVAHAHWRSKQSGLEPWDVLTPNRASSNIGEFAMLLPGEENVVLTKEVFVFRVTEEGREQGWDPFYLIWAFSLKAVRNQWRRIALMQTNREDCGHRYREIKMPNPASPEWAADASAPFRNYFLSLSDANSRLLGEVRAGDFKYIASVVPPEVPEEEDPLDLITVDSSEDKVEE